MSRLQVGFVGVGNMGAPMAANIVKGGYPVIVYDRDGERGARFAREHGCSAAATLAELGSAHAVVTMLPTGHDVRQVLLDDGLAASLQPGALVIDMSSSDPVGTRQLGPALAARGLTLLDAPVSGAVPRARAGTLAIMIGCDDRDAVPRAKPLLGTMGERLFEVGPLGAGHAMKALNNFVAASGFIAAAEALLIGKRFGLNPTTVIDVLNASTGRNFLTEVVMKEHVVEGRHATGFSVGLLAKDVKIAADLGAAMRLDAPLTRLVSERWAFARDQLGPARDNSEAIHTWDSDLPDSDLPAE
ncbi:MAG TPA: NAD(P)-dependent oxidoreductase [Steroidobacteraceae bacterium]|nr:NAD(P)-dependent oxidoreductase [Steroidobacteraceae bacterium]